MGISEKLGLGTVQFGMKYGISNQKGQTTAKEVKNILEFAGLNNIKILDSASGYGNAEEILGKNNLSHFQLISKFLPPTGKAKIAEQLYKTLEDLRVSSLYGYLSHRPLEILKHPEHWEELKSFKSEGKVKKIGFSLNEPQELEQLLEEGYFPDLIQVPYNYFDRRFETAIKSLKAKSCEIHTRSAFLQGLFFMNNENLNDYFQEVKSIIKNLQQHENLNGALLKFVLEKPFIDHVITGVENKEQLADNLAKIKNVASLPVLKQHISNNILIPSRWPKN